MVTITFKKSENDKETTYDVSCADLGLSLGEIKFQGDEYVFYDTFDAPFVSSHVWSGDVLMQIAEKLAELNQNKP